MSEEHTKKKKKRQLVVLEPVVESDVLPELVEALDKLAKEKKYVDLQVCPKCKSPMIRRANSMTGDMSGNIGVTPPKYECRKWGWQEKTVIKATNKPTTIREVALLAEMKQAIEKSKNQK